MNARQKKILRRFVQELEKFRGRHTELVSVYVPAGYDIIKIIQHLQEEQGTAENIKDKTTRNNVIGALERLIRHLKLYKKTPENGLATFSGNISEKEGQQDIKVWSLEPPIPLKTRIYRCDQTFVLDLLREMMDVAETFGLIVIDNREASIGLLRGSLVTQIATMTSAVPGKIKSGGQCQASDTLVQTSSGNILKIEDCHSKDIVKSVLFDNYSQVDSKVSDMWFVKKECIYKIITQDPRLMNECSEDHLFFVSTTKGIVEKSAAQLKVGDYLLMPEKIDIMGKIQELRTLEYYDSFIISKKGITILKKEWKQIGSYQRDLARSIGLTQPTMLFNALEKPNTNRDNLYKLCNFLGINFSKFLENYACPPIKVKVNIKLPVVLDAELAQFLGYFTGNGDFENDTLTFSEQDYQVVLSYKNKFERLFNLSVNYKFKEKQDRYQIGLTSMPLSRFIQGEFPDIKNIQNKQIPKQILKSDSKVLAGYLKGLFDAQGYVATDSIRIVSSNKILTGQVLLSLLRFSIISSSIEYGKRINLYVNNPKYKLKINDKESIINFKRFINFTSQMKTKQLNKLLHKKSIVSRAKRILPVRNKIKEIIQEHGISLNSFQLSNSFTYNKIISENDFRNPVLKYIRNERNLYKKLRIDQNYTLLPVKICDIEVIRRPTLMVDISVQNENFIANGILVHNSQQRFARLREEAAHEFYKRVAEVANTEFLSQKEKLNGIIIGGPGPTKETFVNGAYINTELKRKIIGIKDITYTDEFGLHELVEKSHDILVNEEVTKEKQLVQKFFEYLNKEHSRATFGLEKVRRALEYGAVDMLLISDAVDDKIIDELEDKAESTGSKVEIISSDSREGAQLREMGGVAAILRYSLN